MDFPVSVDATFAQEVPSLKQRLRQIRDLGNRGNRGHYEAY